MEPAELAQQAWWQYGILGVVALVFALVIRFLFKQYQREVRKNQDKDKMIADERQAWAVEREKIRGEFDEHHTDLLKEYAQKIQAEHKECQEREATIRRERDEMVERMADEQRKANDAMVEMLQKLQERMVFPRSGRY